MGKAERYGEDFVAAMKRLLLRYPDNLTGIALRLAWCEGLTRDEIYALTWEQVDFARERICLGDREVPFEGDMADCLRLWRADCPEDGGYVAVSTKTNGHVSPQHLSRVVRLALDEEGLTQVKLLDLRNQYIFWQVDKRGWESAICNAGISLTTYRILYTAKNTGEIPAEAKKEPNKTGYDLNAVLEDNKDSAEGLALWLSVRGGLSNTEIIALTWEQVDFAGKAIVLGDRTIPMPEDLSAVLGAALQRRTAEDDRHVLLSPRSRKPLSLDRLSVITRSLLVHAGADLCLPEVRREQKAEKLNRAILDYCAAHDGIALRESMALLGMTQAQAFRRLDGLAAEKILARTGGRYYLYEDVIAPEDYEDAVADYIRRNGAATVSDIRGLLHIGRRPAEKLLTQMVKDGKLNKPPHRASYTLLQYRAF